MTRQLERKYITEYLNEKHEGQHWQPRVWLGPLPPGKEARMYMVRGKWADAIIFDPNEIIIIETKLEPDSKGIGQLDMYEQEFSKTLRFQQHWRKPIRKVLVTTRVDVPVKELADKSLIEYVVYRPEWIKYWEKRRFRL